VAPAGTDLLVLHVVDHPVVDRARHRGLVCFPHLRTNLVLDRLEDRVADHDPLVGAEEARIPVDHAREALASAGSVPVVDAAGDRRLDDDRHGPAVRALEAPVPEAVPVGVLRLDAARDRSLDGLGDDVLHLARSGQRDEYMDRAEALVDGTHGGLVAEREATGLVGS
jgi:hypothetical protein